MRCVSYLSVLHVRSQLLMMISTHRTGVLTLATRFSFDPFPASLGEAFPCDSFRTRLTHQSDTSQLLVCLSGFGAPLSGIWRYEVEVTADEDGQLLAELSAPPAEMLAVYPPLAVQCGASVIVSSRAVSGALVASEWVVSRIGIDCSPPHGGVIWQHGNITTGGAVCLAPSQQTRVAWSFVEAESEVVEYIVTLAGGGESGWTASYPRQAALCHPSSDNTPPPPPLPPPPPPHDPHHPALPPTRSTLFRHTSSPSHSSSLTFPLTEFCRSVPSANH